MSNFFVGDNQCIPLPLNKEPKCIICINLKNFVFVQEKFMNKMFLSTVRKNPV